MSISKNKNLNAAKSAKMDEFYTQITDIEKELLHYKEHFKGKVVFCNCDDPEESNFWRYFESNFDELGLKKLIATHFEREKPSYKLEISNGTGGEHTVVKTPLIQNGDFRSPECIEILKESDIVVTNPPFSLFREYVAQLMEYKKKFLILGNMNAITYKEIFPLIKDNKIWLGCLHKSIEFKVPKYYSPSVYRVDEDGNKYTMQNVRWFTNLDYKERHEDLILYKKYNEIEYLKYDNYDAINVDKINEIPINYHKEMGVPISFIDKYNPEQFEIVGNLGSYGVDGYSLCSAIYINNKKMFKRILIKNKKVITS